MTDNPKVILEKRRFTDDGWNGGWKGYMQAKQTKLQQQFAVDCSNSKEKDQVPDIFKGVSFYVNGYTIPSADELKRLMVKYGGSYHHYYDSKRTSFVIASNLPNSKLKNLMLQKTVKPSWIVDSVQAGHLLPYQDYKLYESTQKMLTFGLGEIPLGVADLKSELPLDKESLSACVSKGSPASSESCLRPAKISAAVGECQDDYKSKPENVKFLSEFYCHSRLHHISTMATEFRLYVERLQDVSRGKFEGIERLKRWRTSSDEGVDVDAGDFSWTASSRVIMHIDLDCFFVSVGLRRRPDLLAQPVAVTHSKVNGRNSLSSKPSFDEVITEASNTVETHGGLLNVNPSVSSSRAESHSSTSEIASCNYEARRCGVRNGMWLGDARKLCPQLATIDYDFEGYKEVAQKLYDIVASYTTEIEAVSCDELFADCSQVLQATNVSPHCFASFIRKEVFQATACTCSVGIARNMLLARIATRKAKPDGQFILSPQMEAKLVDKEDIFNLPGVGHSLGNRLMSLGAKTCADVQRISIEQLKVEFGPKIGQTLYNISRGIDERTIRKHRSRQSVSAEMNYGIRLTEYGELQSLLGDISKEVKNRLQKINVKGKTISLKMKVRKPEAPLDTVKYMGHGLCDNFTRSATLAVETDDAVVIASVTEKLFGQINAAISDIRGVGIQMSRLKSNETCHQANTMDRFLNSRRQVDDGDNVVSNGNKKETATSEAVTFCSPVKSSASPRRNNSDAKKFSPKKASPSKELPFKYLSIDKHFVPLNKTEVNQTVETTSVCNIPSPSLEASDEQQHVLCDDMSDEEMISLLKEWIDSFAVPFTEDIDVVKGCLCGAIARHNLEKVDLCLHLLHRVIQKKGNREWISAYNTIVAEVQKTVMTKYGGHLRVDEFR